MAGRLVRALALDPTSRGFCYAILEGSERLIDWSCSRVSSGDVETFGRRVDGLIRRFRPQIVVLEDPGQTVRGPNARRLITEAGDRAIARDIYVETVTRREVKRHFEASGTTKWEIALAVSRWFPELEPRLPPKRRLWMPEDERMNLFDAVSFALTALWPYEWRKRSSV